MLRRPRQEERKFKVSWNCRGTLSEKQRPRKTRKEGKGVGEWIDRRSKREEKEGCLDLVAVGNLLED